MTTENKPGASSRRVVINSLSGIVRMFAEAAVAFVLSPIVVHHLGNARFGVWELLLGIVGYLGFLELGVSPAVVRGVARASGSGDPEAMRRTFATGTWLLAAMGLVAGVLVLLAAPFGPQITNFQSTSTEPLAALFVLFAANLVVALPNNGFSAFLLGMQKHSFVNIVRALLAVVRGVLVYVVVVDEPQYALVYMAVLVLATEIIESLVFTARIYFTHSGISLHPRYFERRAARDLLAYGAKSTALMASGNLVRRVILVVIAHENGPTAVAYFAIVNRLSDYMLSFVTTLGGPLMAYFSHITGLADRGLLIRNWQQSTRILMLFSLGAPVGLAWLGPPFIARWMGPEYADAGFGALIVLCVGFIVGSVASNSNRLLLATAQHGGVAVWSAVSAPVCLALSIPLGRLWGITGVAGAVTLFGVGQAYAEMYRACAALGVPVRQHLRKTALPYVVPTLILCASLAIMIQLWKPTTYTRIVLIALVSGSAFVASALVAAWQPGERAALRAWLRIGRGRRPADASV